MEQAGMGGSISFEVEGFFDPATFTVSYIVFDQESRDAVVLDPVLDYEPGGSVVSTGSLERLAAFIEERRLALQAIMETHAHADHLSGARVLSERFGVPVVIGEKITTVQRLFKELYHLSDDFPCDGRQFDRLLADGERFEAGTLSFRVLHTPGHTPACVSYLIGDAVFTGDALFMHDYGTGRCDFPGGDPSALYHSVHDRLYALPDETRVFVGHDYQPGGRQVAWETTIGRSKRENPQLRQNHTEEEFVRMRRARDARLLPPRLLHPSVQVNINAGRLPLPESNGVAYLKIPIQSRPPRVETKGG